jgi:hypothetical protein
MEVILGERFYEKTDKGIDRPVVKENLTTEKDDEDTAEERYDTRDILLNGTKPLEVLQDTPEETLVERVERKYNVDLGVDKDTKLEELLKQKGLPAMSETLEDIPEQTQSDVQEWEERFRDKFTKVIKLYIGYYLGNEVDGRKDWSGGLISFIKQLLEEREREAREEVLKELFEWATEPKEGGWLQFPEEVNGKLLLKLKGMLSKLEDKE